jgi:hypothetical protein
MDAIHRRLPELIAELVPDEFEWGPIGDNTLAAWNWAMQLEREDGIDHQVALRVAREVQVTAPTE